MMDGLLKIRVRPNCTINYLAGCIPESKTDWFSVNHYIRRVVIENSGHVLSRERIRGVGNQHTTFSHTAIPHYRQLDMLHFNHFTTTIESLVFG